MKRTYYLSFLLSILFIMGGCVNTSEDINEENTEVAENILGLWYGSGTASIHRFLCLRKNRTCVESTFVLFDGVHTGSIGNWRVRVDGVLEIENIPSYLCNMDTVWFVNGNKADYEEMVRIYDPRTGKTGETFGMPSLSVGRWKGYYENKIITLSFYPDSIMIRTDEPNVGWEGEMTDIVYDWEVRDKVLYLSNDSLSLSAWGVGQRAVPSSERLLFVDFGDVASLFTKE